MPASHRGQDDRNVAVGGNRNEVRDCSLEGDEMQVLPKQPSTKGPAETFTGDVWFDIIAMGEEPSRIRVYRVRFAPGARSAWHSHVAGQTLHVIEGRGLVQSRGGEVVDMRPGDTIYTPPGEWHWHGAAPDHFMSHLAMSESPGEGHGPETEWGDHVTDAEYGSK
jgi:quercetin dioxygenase-like cupin family protein